MLADVLEKFRNRCLEKCGFCPSLYVSAPALSWDIMFIMTKAEPELVSYDDMYFFTKKEWQVTFLIFLKDAVKETIKIQYSMILTNRQNKLYT